MQGHGEAEIIPALPAARHKGLPRRAGAMWEAPNGPADLTTAPTHFQQARLLLRPRPPVMIGGPSFSLFLFLSFSAEVSHA